MTVTEATHLGEDDIPWVDTGIGLDLKLVQVDIELGLWIVRNRFVPGAVVQKHKQIGRAHV